MKLNYVYFLIEFKREYSLEIDPNQLPSINCQLQFEVVDLVHCDQLYIVDLLQIYFPYYGEIDR